MTKKMTEKNDKIIDKIAVGKTGLPLALLWGGYSNRMEMHLLKCFYFQKLYYLRDTNTTASEIFRARFLIEAEEFISGLNPKTIKKILYNIDLAEQTNDPDNGKERNKNLFTF